MIDFSKITVGMKNLTEGYIDYSQEVIKNRALPDLRDGFKPVNRRIMYTLYSKFKKGEQVKSNTVVGAVMKLHPHGDASIYSALVLMVDKNGTMSMPVIEGQGNFGGVHTTDPAAASRYTEIKLHPFAQEYFGEMNGINFVPNYDATASEPDVLPVSFPAILCNSTSGIAVGFRSNMPSFNFNDVIDLTMEYIKNGKCTTVIYPDFVTGGFYVKNNKELDKLMRTGLAKIKLRGRVTTAGKEITVVEFPFGKTIQGLQAQIQAANINGVKDVGDVDDFEHGKGLLIACSAKNKVNDVLLQLYKDSDLQYTFSADLMSILDGKPVRYGVWGIIAEWVKWRRQVLLKEYTQAVASWKESVRKAQAFVEIVKDKAKVEELLKIIVKQSDKAAVDYILANYDNSIVDEDIANWVVRRRANEFRDGGKYLKQYTDLMNSIKEYEGYISDIDTAIYNQLATLKATYGSQFPRRTEVTTTDYEFQSAKEAEVAKDLNECTYVVKDNFIKKIRGTSLLTDDAQFTVQALASDTLIAIDNRGRVLKIYCDDLPYCGATELGVYIPRYCHLNETDDYKIWWIGKMSGETKMILYKDGNIGFLDTSEWIGLDRRVRVHEKGISQAVAPLVGAVIDVPDALFVLGTSGKLGYAEMRNVKRKDRTAKTRVFTLGKGDSIAHYLPISVERAVTGVVNIDRYATGTLQFLASNEDWKIDDVQFSDVLE